MSLQIQTLQCPFSNTAISQIYIYFLNWLYGLFYPIVAFLKCCYSSFILFYFLFKKIRYSGVQKCHYKPMKAQELKWFLKIVAFCKLSYRSPNFFFFFFFFFEQGGFFIIKKKKKKTYSDFYKHHNRPMKTRPIRSSNFFYILYFLFWVRRLYLFIFKEPMVAFTNAIINP